MTNLKITIPDRQLSQLEQAAEKIGVSMEDLVRVSINELLAKRDKEFEQAVRYVLRKNAKLYRRLA